MCNNCITVPGYGEVVLKEAYRSKRNKNKVYSIITKENKLEVLKIFDGNDGMLKCSKEAENIEYLGKMGIRVPNILHKADNILLLEYIQGDLINDLVEKLDMGEWTRALAEWLVSLHRVKKDGKTLIKGDVNLRNFIYASNKIYGLDFEEISTGDPREDIGDLCFFILTNNPAYTRDKDKMVRSFIKSYETISCTKLHDIPLFILNSRKKALIRRKANLHEVNIRE